MAAVAKWRNDLSGNLVTGGSNTAFTLFTNQVLTSFVDGFRIAARMHDTSGVSPTLNVDSLGAKPIHSLIGENVGNGALLENAIYNFTYDSDDDAWIVHSAQGDYLSATDNPDLVAIEALEGTTGALRKTAANTWALDDGTTNIVFIKDNSGNVLTTGVLGDVQVPFACTITGVTLLADQSGSCVVDIWKDSYANFPPTDDDSITDAAPPTISGGIKVTNSSLSGWTTSISAGDILRFNLDSVSSITRIEIMLRVSRYV